MNEKQNAVVDGLDFDIDEKEQELADLLEREFLDLEALRSDSGKIRNPEELGQVVLDEIWKQFGTQIGFDITDETLIQRYDREHPETYEEEGKRVMQDQRYKDAVKEMKKSQAEGTLVDEYTGKLIGNADKANLDHTVSRKEIADNPRRKQANIPTEDLANKSENLNPTNESLNKSKGKRSVQEMVDTREAREADLIAQHEKAVKKIEQSGKSDVEKRLEIEKSKKRLQGKLDADDELMLQKDRQARQAINSDIAKGAVKEAGIKAGKDAVKVMLVQALFTLLKEIIGGLVRFFKAKAKSFKKFLEEMKEALHRFFLNLTTFLRTGAATAVGSIVSEAFGPVVSLFQKLASVIKQGFRSLGDAIAYLADKKNRNKSFSIKVAEVGKIVVSGLVVAGAIFGGDVLEKALIVAWPPLGGISIPLLGSLANIIGMFISSLLSGIIGAIVINYIDKAISKQLKSDNMYSQIEKGNEILGIQSELIALRQDRLQTEKIIISSGMAERRSIAKGIVDEITTEKKAVDKKAESELDEINRLLASLE